jgi:3-phenylpropionate/trans-cinnamate dioxygenase ferredoxin subunit
VSARRAATVENVKSAGNALSAAGAEDVRETIGARRAGPAKRIIPVCGVDELPPGERRLVEVAGRSIGVFNVHGRYYALRNLCPHRRAPLCLGRIRGLVVSDGPYSVRLERDGEIIACPWHGWEFDITTGRSHFNPHKLRVKTYDVTVGPFPAGPGECLGRNDEDPSVETYSVTAERGVVLLHLPI